jgi:OOP family OmpA-OmpF porin
LPGAYPELNKLLTQIRKFPNSRWQITGYTDNIGSDKINYDVSLARAESVLEYFYSRGIAKTRFIVLGRGEENPIADNNTEEGRALNRRVVITRIK